MRVLVQFIIALQLIRLYSVPKHENIYIFQLKKKSHLNIHKNMYLYKILHSLICSRSKKEMNQYNSIAFIQTMIIIISTRALSWWQFCFKVNYFKLNSPYVNKLLTRLIYIHIIACQIWCQTEQPRNFHVTLWISSEMLWKEAEQ